MRKYLFRLGLSCLMSFMAIVVQAQGDVTAEWNWENNLPAGIQDATNIQGKTAELASTADGIVMFVDATNGKLYSIGRNNAQFNVGTILRVPVKTAKDIVTVKNYPGYNKYTIGGVAAAGDLNEHRATSAEAAQGYVEIVATESGYLYGVKVVHTSMIQEKPLYSTNFSEWTKASAATKESVVAWKTKYSHEDISFSIYNTEINPAGTNSKFNNGLPLGWAMSAKAADPYIITSPLASITKVRFVHGATGGSRGWKLWAKGEGDADWVVISETVANPAGWCEVTADVNRTNCQLKFTNLNSSQNAYMFELDIYGNVDMSKTPTLGSFSVNGTKYSAVDIFEEQADGTQAATIEIPKAQTLISETNPLADIVAENGEVTGVTYETTGEGTAQKTVVTINVTANDKVSVYKATFIFKPDFTLSYYDTDGTTLLGTQLVEKDASIVAFGKGEADVKVADGKKFRGWFVAVDGGRKYSVNDIVTENINLYGIATDIEVASTTARYTYNLKDIYFYPEDHEAFNCVGQGKYHDNQHGWQFAAGDDLQLLVGGNAYIIASLCRYGGNSTITVKDDAGNVVGTAQYPVSVDGQTVAFYYEGPSTTLHMTFSGAPYVHSVSICNVADAAVEKNEQGYFVVKAGDAGNLLTTIDVANSVASNTERTYIFVPDGTYDIGNTCLTPISGNNISLIGQSMDKTVIVNTPKEEGIGVTATIFVTGNNTYIQDITLKNAYDYYKPGFAGRAVCLQDKGNRTICKNVKMLSYQDTYYSNANGQYYWETSEIHGTVDFICGSGDVFFNGCKLVVEKRNADGKGECTITAPYTDASSKFGYVFDNCVIDNYAEKFNYGRAWGGKPRCAYLNTTLLQPDKLVANRWTLGGMNVAADKFVEYNTLNAGGSVISPSSNTLTFTHSSGNKTMETILTADEAAGYALDKVFTNWTPAVYAAQQTVAALTANGNLLAWQAVEGVTTYALFNNGKFVALTNETSYTVADGNASGYSVRAANGMGGFGEETKATTTGISGVTTGEGNVASTVLYNMQGIRVGNDYNGVVVKIDTLDDGSRIVTKVMK